jgi:hypothetical protein
MAIKSRSGRNIQFNELPITPNDFELISEILKFCTTKISGKQQILRRKIFVLLAFLGRNEYKITQIDTLNICAALHITESAGSLSKYKGLYNHIDEYEKNLIESLILECTRTGSKCSNTIKNLKTPEFSKNDKPEYNSTDRKFNKESSKNSQSKIKLKEYKYSLSLTNYHVISMRKSFSSVIDGRDKRGRKYTLLDQLTYIIFRTLCRNASDINEGKTQMIDKFLEPYLDNTDTVPKHNAAIGIINKRINGDQLASSLVNWLHEIQIGEDVIGRIEADMKNSSHDWSAALSQISSMLSFSVPPDASFPRTGLGLDAPISSVTESEYRNFPASAKDEASSKSTFDQKG